MTIGRAVRMGQTKAVTVVRMVVEDTVEVRRAQVDIRR